MVYIASFVWTGLLLLFLFVFRIDSTLSFILSIVITIILFIILYVIIKYRKLNREEIKLKKDKKKIIKRINNGTWDFPSESFYIKCKKNNLIDLNSDIESKKRKLLVEEILKDNLIPNEYYESYTTIDKIKEFYEVGKRIALIKEQKIKEEAEIKYNTPKNVDNESYSLMKKFYNDMKYLYGKEKRVFWLNKTIISKESESNELLQYQNLARQNMVNKVSSSITFKGNDWAIAGGIAQGLAGPAAGLAIAQQTIINNEKEKQKLQNDADYSVKIFKDSLGASDLIQKLDSEVYNVKQKLEDAKLKIVLDDIPTEKVFNALSCSSSFEHEYDYTSLTVTFYNKYSEALPNNCSFVMDGTINVNVYCDDIFVEQLCVPLPIDGVEIRGTAKTQVFMTRIMEGAYKRHFRCEYTPNNLWIMEK